MLFKNKNHASMALFPIVLFGVFTITAMFTVTIGASVYQKLSNSMDSNSNVRAAYQYIANQVRACNQSESVYEETITYEDSGQKGTIQTLTMESSSNDLQTYNRIYYYNGYLMQNYMTADLDFFPQNGEKIVAVSGASFEKQGDLLQVMIQGTGFLDHTFGIQLRN